MNIHRHEDDTGTKSHSVDRHVAASVTTTTTCRQRGIEGTRRKLSRWRRVGHRLSLFRVSLLFPPLPPSQPPASRNGEQFSHGRAWWRSKRGVMADNKLTDLMMGRDDDGTLSNPAKSGSFFSSGSMEVAPFDPSSRARASHRRCVRYTSTTTSVASVVRHEILSA